MKPPCYLFIFILLGAAGFTTSAQSLPKNSRQFIFYGGPRLTGGKFGGGMGGTFIAKNNWGVSLEARMALYKSENLPHNFEPGMCLFGNCIPDDITQVASLRLVRGVRLADRLSLTFEAGAGYMHREINYFTASEPDWFPGNYNSEIRNHSLAGADARAVFHYRIGDSCGLGAGLNGHVNRQVSWYGVEINFIFVRF